MKRGMATTMEDNGEYAAYVKNDKSARSKQLDTNMGRGNDCLNYRSKLVLCIDILQAVASKPMTKSEHVFSESFIEEHEISEILDFLVNQKTITLVNEANNTFYEATEKGVKILTYFRKNIQCENQFFSYFSNRRF